MKKILLTKGKYTIVDDSDYELLSQWSWYYNGGYAVRGCPERILMHRVITNCPIELEVDHINMDKLDNRRINLRNVTKSVNLHNTNAKKTSKSNIKGVFWNPINKKWRVQFSIDKKRIEVGSFDSLERAIVARKEVELSHAI